eukprot:TRINITY_DN15911_c0_g1_i1.p1 TRINITY_DN15911_c0_g1~~TRINITY_DN15911_c0_g1_i1.p1  ORF type:complete len:297 (-),score=37.57 TRINITY_DN15911_c0_g1_i1:217-1107(-)
MDVDDGKKSELPRRWLISPSAQELNETSRRERAEPHNVATKSALAQIKLSSGLDLRVARPGRSSSSSSAGCSATRLRNRRVDSRQADDRGKQPHASHTHRSAAHGMKSSMVAQAAAVGENLQGLLALLPMHLAVPANVAELQAEPSVAKTTTKGDMAWWGWPCHPVAYLDDDATASPRMPKLVQQVELTPPSSDLPCSAPPLVAPACSRLMYVPEPLPAAKVVPENVARKHALEDKLRFAREEAPTLLRMRTKQFLNELRKEGGYGLRVISRTSSTTSLSLGSMPGHHRKGVRPAH